MIARSRRLFACVSVGLAGLVGLAGCAVPVPQVTPEPESTITYPVLDEGRLDRILTSVQADLDDADEALDAKELPPRVTGQAEKVRAAEYRLTKATKDDDNSYHPQPLGTDMAAAIVAATEGWPRTVMVATNPPEGANAARLLLLTQDDPRAEYSLIGWVRLLPGVETPEINSSEVGVDPVDLDDADLLITPDQVAGAYADVLDKGDEAKAAGEFNDDPYRDFVTEDLKAQNKALEVAGEVSQKSEPTGGTWALGTADGGAIVFTALTSVLTYERTVAGSKMSVGETTAALNDGEAEVKTSLDATYEQMIAFYIPPAGGDAQIDVLGAERVLAKVTSE